MGMTLKIGNLSLPVGQTGCRPSIRARRDRRGQPYSKESRLDVEGMLFGDDSQDIKAQAAAMVLALENGRNDIILYDALSRATGVILIARTAVGGFIACEDVRFDEVNGTQWETYLNFRFTATAEYSLDNAPPGTLIDFQEKIVRVGNSLSRETEQEVLTGDPVRVQLVERTACTTLQAGFAVGYRGVPKIPTPIWPRYVMNAEVTDAETSGGGYGNQEFRMEWQYRHESKRRLAGRPNQWI